MKITDITKRRFFAKLDEVEKYIITEKRCPTIHDSNSDVGKMGQWLSRHSGYYRTKRFVMRDDDVYNAMKEFKEKYHIIDPKQAWYDNLERIRNFIKENGRIPKSSEDRWVYNQITKFNNKTYCMKDPAIYKEFSQFLEENIMYIAQTRRKYNNMAKVETIYAWYIRLNIIENCIKEDTCLNREHVKWLINQKINFKKRRGVMKDKDIYTTFTTFLGKYGSIVKIDKMNVDFVLSS